MTERRVLTAAVVVAGGTVHRPGWLVVEHGLVSAAGSGTPPASVGPADVVLGDVVVVPGFVDMHVHGGGGATFTDGTVEAARTVVSAHRAHGTTRLVASLVSAHPDPLREQVATLAGLVESGELAGIHLEGPWLSPTRIGAHDPATVRPPDADEIHSLLDAGRGGIAMVTIAPELPGGLAAVEQLREAGVVVAVGHTEASYDQVRAAIAAGATVGTHLFNAMRPIMHREPGPVVALAEAPGVVVELIVDGVHLHPAMYDQVRRWVGPSRIALVTDAMAAAGMADGAYTLGSLDVTVEGGQARVAGTDTIAGGTATTDQLFRAAAGGPDGVDDDEILLQAVEQTSVVPARALRLPRHDLAPGTPADLVVLDRDLQVRRVLVRGA
ncbi:N-acetylglucosamine-6-phosphate deacetylase [Nocardioides albidus]|uniref:N-acetylglucosamine-6-phosphate deacetylase n=1 Tax=Nocardioides albidus TaxID=1517589 RepID=A0A5C4VWY8_9ACTN|nr:N-acetylglucosamine-6-phosphate deacetylase [Nocardioides albidus]